jgi:hypothetical protein
LAHNQNDDCAIQSPASNLLDKFTFDGKIAHYVEANQIGEDQRRSDERQKPEESGEASQSCFAGFADESAFLPSSDHQITEGFAGSR